jgi:hypothetical protein
MKDLDLYEDQLTMKRREIENDLAMKDKEFKALSNNVIKDQKFL